MSDPVFMRLALREARRGWGRTSPNPMVGAVVVKHGRIIGRGYHAGPGTPHAEVMAIRSAGEPVRRATLYVNLEPCCHTAKRTPPCTRTLIEQGVSTVVVGMRDPNPEVSGRGLEALRRAGIRVREGVLAAEALRLNEAYAKFITRRVPFVTLKAGQTLDGKIATATGASQWITSETARRFVQHLRAGADAVMVGVGTILRDDPELTVRLRRRALRQPLRIVVDSRLRTPSHARVIRQMPDRTIVATTPQAPETRIRRIESLGPRVLVVKERSDRVSLAGLVHRLGEMDVASVLIEGGSSLNSAAVSEGVVDKLLLIMAPKLMLGQKSISVFGGPSPETLDRLIGVHHLRIRRLGPDLLVEGYLSGPEKEQ